MLVKLCTHKPLNIRIHLGSKLRSLLQGRRHNVAISYFASAGVAGLPGDRQYGRTVSWSLQEHVLNSAE